MHSSEPLVEDALSHPCRLVVEVVHVTFNVKSMTVDELPKTPWTLWLSNDDRLQLLRLQGVAAKHDRHAVHGTLSTRDWTKRQGLTRLCSEDQTSFVAVEYIFGTSGQHGEDDRYRMTCQFHGRQIDTRSFTHAMTYSETGPCTEAVHPSLTVVEIADAQLLAELLRSATIMS